MRTRALGSLPLQEHPLSAAAVRRAYARLSWTVAASLGLLAVAVTHAAVPKTGQRAVFAAINKGLTNIPGFVIDLADRLHPRTAGFYALLLVVATVAARLLIAFRPLKAGLQTYAGWMTVPPLQPLLPRIIDNSAFAPAADDALFAERTDALGELLALAGDEQPYRMIVLSGPNGIGKTRLALAWLAVLDARPRTLLPAPWLGWRRAMHPARWRLRAWQAGFLDVAGIDQLRMNALSEWQPQQPTAVVLDATELPEESWRKAEADLRQGSARYLFPVRVLVLSYQPPGKADPRAPAQPDSVTNLPLGPLSPDAVCAIYPAASGGQQLSLAQAETVVAITGGLPILVRILAADAGWQPSTAGLASAMDVLTRYTGGIAQRCGALEIGAEAGEPTTSLTDALAIATLARRLDLAGFGGLNLGVLPPHPAIRVEAGALAGIGPPLLGLAWLFHHARNTNAQTRQAVARRAWAESPDGVASMLRHFWLSVARSSHFDDAGPQPGFADPAWMQAYDQVPAEADAVAHATWLRTRFGLLRMAALSQEDRAAMAADVGATVAGVASGAAGATLVAEVADFWCDAVTRGDLAAWDSLGALASRDRLAREAWRQAAPSAARILHRSEPAAADALRDCLVQDARTEGSPEAWFAAAAVAIELAGLTSDGCTRAEALLQEVPAELKVRPGFEAVRAALNVNWIAVYGAAERWEDMAAARTVLADLANRFPKNEDIQLELAKGMLNAILYYGEAERWEDMEAARTVLADLANCFPKNEDIQLELAKGTFNAISRYGEAKRWEDMEAAPTVLADLANHFPKNEHIQLQLAMGMVNAISDYGKAKRWEAMEAARTVLADLANRFLKNEDIQLGLAMGMVNAISDYGKAKRWEAMEAARTVLADLANRFLKNEDIQLRLAMGMVNAILGYGEAERWEDMEVARTVLADLAKRFPKNEDIQLRLAMGMVNAISCYGKAERWEDMEAARTVLADLANHFPKNEDIQLELARGMLNAILYYGKAERWEDMEAARTVLADLANRFLKNEDIQLQLAMGTLNAISDYGKAKRLEDMEAARTVLADLANRFPNNEDIQLELAKGMVNAILGYGKAERWEDMEAARTVLADLANHFPKNEDIQLQLANGMVNAILEYCKAERWEDMEAARTVLADLANRFPKNEDIQLRLAEAGHLSLSKTAVPAIRRSGRQDLILAARRCPTHSRIQAIAHVNGVSFAQQACRILPSPLAVPPRPLK